MKVYIAAPYPMHADAAEFKRELEAAGVRVTSRWLTGQQADDDASARQDLEDVRAAHLLIALNPSEWATSGTGGRHVELGYAIALGKPVLLIGERSNVFHHLDSIVHVGNRAAAIAVLQQLESDTSDLLKRLVIAFDSNQDEEVIDTLQDARRMFGFVRYEDVDEA